MSIILFDFCIKSENNYFGLRNTRLRHVADVAIKHAR